MRGTFPRPSQKNAYLRTARCYHHGYPMLIVVLVQSLALALRATANGGLVLDPVLPFPTGLLCAYAIPMTL